MAFKIAFDSNNVPIEPTFILANRNGNKLGALTNVHSISVDGSIDVPKVMFTVTKYDNGEECHLWNEIDNFKLLYCKDWDYWFEITIELSSTDDTNKSIVGTALSQAELSQIMLYNIEINTEDDIAREDYVIPTTIYNEDAPEASLLNRIMEKVPHYTIDHVDDSLKNIQRTFTFNSTSLKDALDEIAQEIQAIVVYGNGTKDVRENGIEVPQRTISLYDLESVCGNCGYRGEFATECPSCGSDNITPGYGEDTTIFISKDNLTDDIDLTGDADSVKNCFMLEAGDDLMTATVHNCNPNGTGYIWSISSEMKADMPVELAKKLDGYDKQYEHYKSAYNCNVDTSLINAYNALVTKYRAYDPKRPTIPLPIVGYPRLMNAIYEMIDFNLFLSDTLMPNIGVKETTASQQVALLTDTRLSPIAVSNTDYISAATAESNVLAMARIIVSSQYKVELKESSFDKSTKVWRGSFKLTNYYDDEDTATGGSVTVRFNNDFKLYVEQKVNDVLNKNTSESYDIVDIMKQGLTVSGNSFSGAFMDTIAKYSLKYLQIMYDCCQGCLDVLIEQGVSDKKTWAGSSPNLYDEFYMKYYNKQNALAYEISVRENEIATITSAMKNAEIERKKIQNSLDMKAFLGDSYWKVFCSYRRDDTYSNSNYISDGLSNSELFENALKFLEVAEKEIKKACTIQYTLSSTLKNLLAIEEFSKLVDHFEVGNWLRIEIDGKIYKLRLVGYTIDYDNLADLSVEFSDVIDYKSNVVKIDDILTLAQSMASNFDYVERQANKGFEAKEQLQNWTEYGFDASAAKIMNDADNQDVVFDTHGMLFRRYDNFTDDFLPTQLKIINSTLAVTTDNWETTKAAIGNFWFRNPTTGDIESVYGVNGELVVGKLLIGNELGIYNGAGTMTFDANGFKVTNGVNSFAVNPNAHELMVLSNSDRNILWVDTDGILHIVGDGSGLDITANDVTTDFQSQLKVNSDAIESEVKRAQGVEEGLSGDIKSAREELSSSITQTAEAITSEVSKKVGYDEVISSINQTAEEITIKANRISLEGTVTANNNFKILEDGSIEANNGKFNGTITVANGINTFTIDPNSPSGLMSLGKNSDDGLLWTDEDGMLHIVGDGKGIDITENDTVNDLYTNINITAEGIRSTVSKNQSKYDTTGKQIDLFGYGEPEDWYKASENNGQVYFDTETGYLYTSDGVNWSKSKAPLPTIEENIYSQIEQTADGINSTVAKNQIKYDTSNEYPAIKYYGYGPPDEEKMNPSYSIYSGKKYLDVTSGYVYRATNGKWEIADRPLNTLENKIMSKIEETAEGITTTVSDTYETKDDASIKLGNAYSKIEEKANSITSTVAKSQSKYDTTGYSITYYGYGSPSTDQYSAEISGRYYLDVGTGRLYQSSSGRWNPTSTYLPTVQNNVMSQIKQTGSNIAMIVSRSKYNRINDYSIDYYGYGAPSNSLYPPSDNYSNRYFDIGSGWIYTVQYSYGSYSWNKYVQLTEIEYATTTYTDDSITNLVAENGKVQSMIRQELDNITISASKIRLEGYTTINRNFSIDEYGNMSAVSANLSGDIKMAGFLKMYTSSSGPSSAKNIIAYYGNEIQIGMDDISINFGNNTAADFDISFMYKCIFHNSLRVFGDVTLWDNTKSQVLNGDKKNLLRYNTNNSKNAIWVGANPTYADNMFLSANNVYVGDGTGNKVTSDSRLKHDIEKLTNYKYFIMQLNPVKFKYNNGTSGRYHCGFEASAVEEAMLNSIGDFGIFVKRPKTLPNEEYTTVDLNNDETYICALRYDEFIAPHIALTQEHEREIITLKEEISELKNTIEQMKNKSVA